MKDDFMSHTDAALLNRNVVLRYIKENAPVSRTDIWESLNISRASVTQIIKTLADAHLVIETDERRSTGGRNQRYLRLHDDAKHMLVFDWTMKRLCLVNMGSAILDVENVDFSGEDHTPVLFQRVLLEAVARLAARNGNFGGQTLDLGLVMPGQIDSRNNTVLYSVELGWRNVNLERLFADEYAARVFVERTANMMALGEAFFGSSPRHEHSLLVLLENVGLGMASVIHGNCQHGGNYMYGELGHIKLPDKTYCSCGQQGCLEAVIKKTLSQNGNVIDADVIHYIAIGVSAAINITDCDNVRLVGHLACELDLRQESDLLLEIRSMVSNERFRCLDLRIGRDYADATIRGMSVHIFNNWFPTD